MMLVGFSLLGFAKANLMLGFYKYSCPNAEKIVSDFVKNHISIVPTRAAALLRMQFNDCFVRVQSPFISIHLSILPCLSCELKYACICD